MALVSVPDRVGRQWSGELRDRLLDDALEGTPAPTGVTPDMADEAGLREHTLAGDGRGALPAPPPRKPAPDSGEPSVTMTRSAAGVIATQGWPESLAPPWPRLRREPLGRERCRRRGSQWLVGGHGRDAVPALGIGPDPDPGVAAEGALVIEAGAAPARGDVVGQGAPESLRADTVCLLHHVFAVAAPGGGQITTDAPQCMARQRTRRTPASRSGGPRWPSGHSATPR